MSIIRAPRPESGWYALDKRISEDGRLGWAARGLLIFLLGKPDNWSISVAHLIAQTKDSRIKSGRDAVYALLRELESAGYLQRHQGQADGRFGEVNYTVSEYPIHIPKAQRPLPLTGNPEAGPPLTDEPDTDEPHTGQPYTADPTLIKTERATRTDSNQSCAIGESDAGRGGVRPVVREAKPKASEDPPLFSEAWAEYPKREGGSSKPDARKAWVARVKSGVSGEEMLEGVKKYAAYIRSIGKEHTRYVKQAATFFGPGEHWKNDYTARVEDGEGRGNRRESAFERQQRIHRELDARE